MVKIIIRVVLCVGLFSLAGWFCRKQTDGFTILKISSDLSYQDQWERSSPSRFEILKMFQSPFFYLARGEQCYVFVSQDKQYVLKFFRHNHMRPSPWVHFLPQEKRDQVVLKKRALLEEDFRSYCLAYDELKEETGLLYLHLNKTQDLRIQATIVDKLGIAHVLDLDGMEFLVQRCAEPLYSALEKKICLGKLEEAKSTITQLVHLLMKTRYEMGIIDTDPDLNINYGCIGSTPIQIDMGRLKKNPVRQAPTIYQQEIAHITDNLHQWLDQHSQELDRHLQLEIEQLSQWGHNRPLSKLDSDEPLISKEV